MHALKNMISRFTSLFAIFIVISTLAVQMSQACDDVDNIESLISRLDAKKFNDRESATEQLIEYGHESLKPVATEYFEANPEIAWRIKRILKKIATEASEELTSLQAIGVLICLNQEWDNELSGLLTKWRVNRSNRAVEFLVDKGAATTPTGAHRQLVFAQFNQATTFELSGTKNPLRLSGKRIPKSEALAEIDQIVAGDFESVQDFVFSRLSGEPDADVLAQQPQIFVRGQRLNLDFNNNNGQSGTFIEIGEKWEGTADDLKRLNDIHSLHSLRLVGQEFTADTLTQIEQLENLKHLGIVDAQPKSVSIVDIKMPPQINSLELGGITIDTEVAKWMTSISLTNLTLSKCQVRNDAAKELEKLQQLVTLDLRRIRIDRALFRTLSEITSLKRLYLAVCKFKGQDYRDFSRIRPRIVVFNPVSFLGVQARPTIGGADNWSCEIEMVVPESAADLAGVRPGDIIESVNGDDVETFQDLRMYISQHEVGEKMILSVNRAGKQIELTAELGSIEDR